MSRESPPPQPLDDPRIERRLERAHARARDRGVQPVVYWLTRAVLEPALRLVFWLGLKGRENIPRRGGLILAANHRSFLDPFVIALGVRRPIYFVAKQELFHNALVGWWLNCLGAFPVRRGESDEDSMRTARTLLERGEAVVIFPEGTRTRQGPLQRARRGVGRLALETGVPVLPVAVIGTERARPWGFVIRPCRVRIRYGRALTYPHVEAPSPRLASAVTDRVWPVVGLQWEWLGGTPPEREPAPLASLGRRAA